MKVAALCVLKNSVYKQIDDVECYDKDRDAYNFQGGMPVIAHPPCAQWSRMRSFAKDDPKEKELARLCYLWIKKEGGVLEHPQGSLLWKSIDLTGGRLYSVDQNWFGFPARKRTYLWFYGCKPAQIVLRTVMIEKPVNKMQYRSGERSRTTLPMAEWLVDSVGNHSFDSWKAEFEPVPPADFWEPPSATDFR